MDRVESKPCVQKIKQSRNYLEKQANRPKDRAEYGFVGPSQIDLFLGQWVMRGGGVDRSNFWWESDLDDSCSDKMGQMELVENVRTCFVAADNVKAAAWVMSTYQKVIKSSCKWVENGIQPFTITLLHAFALWLIIFIFGQFKITTTILPHVPGAWHFLTAVR